MGLPDADQPIFLTGDADEQRALLAKVLKQAGSTEDVRKVAAALAAQAALRDGKATEPQADIDMPDLSPRLRETLLLLLRGEGEKQIAVAMGISPHTVHVHVKNLYRKFDVTTRGELLAKFVRLAGEAPKDAPGQDDA